MNNFLNNIKIISVPSILISGETITNIAEKANIFNEFVVSQCTHMENSSKHPSLLMNTSERETQLIIRKMITTSTIKLLNPTKAHGFDNISIRMIQFCGDSITFPLALILKSSLSQGVFC